ncbi:MAG TPA: hypothetical protein V6D22_14405 [Candidatus Obscuribacterales bacterium]
MKSIIGGKTQASLLAVALLAGTIVAANAPAYAGRFAQNHPRRAEVLHRDNRINRSLNRNYGHLGGHYGQLKAEDRGIRRQEQAEARANGGHITKGEKRQLNHEENALRAQEHADRTNK